MVIDLDPEHMTSAVSSVLLVDDDPKFTAFARAGFAEFDIEATTAASVAEALEFLDGDVSIDAILLDIMMPGMSGWSLLAAVRERGLTLPVIFVTARESVEERVRGLRMGADDYIIKPFAFAELLARLEAVVRRRRAARELRVGDLHLDLANRVAHWRERTIDLSPKEFDLLRVLAQTGGRVVSRAELLRSVWHIEHDPGTNVVDVHVGRLRRKLDGAEPSPLRTVRGAGYTWSTDEADAP